MTRARRKTGKGLHWAVFAALSAPAPVLALQPADGAAIRYGTGEVATTVEQVLDFKPEVRDFLSGQESALDDAKAHLAQFKADMDRAVTPAFIAEANNMQDRKTLRIAQRAERMATSDANRMMQVDVERLKQSSNRGAMLGRYADMLFTSERLRQLAKIYPDSTAIAEAQAAVAKRVGTLGDFADVEQLAAANAAELAAARRLRAPQQTNAALARDFERAFRSSIWTQKEYAGAQILKLNLIDSGWKVERNQITGIILNRYQYADLGVKRTDGKCFAYMIRFEQQATGGGGYGQSIMRSGTDNEMLCENI